MKNLSEYIYLSTLVRSISDIFPVSKVQSVMRLLDLVEQVLTEEDKLEIADIQKKVDQYAYGVNDLQKKRSKRAFMTPISANIKRMAAEWDTETPWGLSLKPLQLNKTCFPKAVEECTNEQERNVQDFMADLEKAAPSNLKLAAELLLSLLFKYAYSIPSPYESFSDISLYDHCKVSAALAVCLYEFYLAKEDVRKAPFLLIGGDFSGIQSYIYQIVSKYAGKNLKGRSFYLRILSDAVVRFLLKKLDLYQTHILYNSGGSFYIIAPNTRGIIESLQNVIPVIEERLFNAHRTTLFVAIDYVPLSTDALMHQSGKSLQDVWGELFQKRDSKKSSKFSNLLSDRFEDFFCPGTMGGDARVDTITGEEIQKGEQYNDKNEIGVLKDITYRQILLGKGLREADALVVSEEAIADWSKENGIEPAGLGFYYYLVKNDTIEAVRPVLDSLHDKVRLITLNGKGENCEFMPLHPTDNIYSLDFYGGNIFNNQTFNDFCEKNSSEDALERLGILRMDVDNLGSLFQSGICPEKAVLARYASFSRSFDYFFSGYLNIIQQESAPSTSFIIYSGGDDVFIVGSWDDMIKIAERIRNDFREFTCRNPAFSISGGIAIIAPKYPLVKGAEESAGEEDNAKGHVCYDANKNSISFMKMALNWDLEYPAVKKLKDKLVELYYRNELPKSFISKILMHFVNADIQKHQIRSLKTYWMLTYDLSRMVNRQMSHSVKLLIDNCKSEVCGKNCTRLDGEKIHTEYHPLELWAFAARWAELDIRTNKE